MRKLIFSLIIIIALGIFGPTHAALRVPKNAPLQPIPESDVGPNYQSNVNSPGNTINENEAASQEQIENQQEAEAFPGSDQQSLVEGAGSSDKSVLVYWGLLILGILGLIGVVVWSYLRFGKNR